MSLLIALLQALVLFAVARRCCPGSFASPARGCITAADRVLQEYRDILETAWAVRASVLTPLAGCSA